MHVLINTVIWSTDAPYSPDGIDCLSWPRRFVHMFGYRMNWARLRAKCAHSWNGQEKKESKDAMPIVDKQPTFASFTLLDKHVLSAIFFFFFPNTGRKCTGGHKHLKHIQRAEREKDETPSARPSLSLFDVLMKWSLNVRQVSHLHARPFLHPCTHYSAN